MPRASMPLAVSNTGSSKIKGLNEVNSTDYTSVYSPFF